MYHGSVKNPRSAITEQKEYRSQTSVVVNNTISGHMCWFLLVGLIIDRNCCPCCYNSKFWLPENLPTTTTTTTTDCSTKFWYPIAVYLTPIPHQRQPVDRGIGCSPSAPASTTGITVFLSQQRVCKALGKREDGGCTHCDV